MCNPFCGNILIIHIMSKRNGGQNRNLAAGIPPFYICSGISLCIASFLSFFQRCIKLRTFRIHSAEDIIRRSIQNAGNFFYLICRQRRMQRADNGNPPSAACFKQKVDIFFPGNFQQLYAMLCYQLFVGSTHRFSLEQRFFHKRIRRLCSSHHFHHDSNLWILQDHLIIMNNFFLYRITGKISQIQHIFNLNLIPRSLTDQLAIGMKYFHHTGTHSSISQHCYLYHKSHSLPNIFK